MSGPTTALHEVFSGIQGEGTLVGVRQVFVRFHGCQLACAYCDTPASRGAAPATCRVECAAAGRVLEDWPNPLSVPEVLRAIDRLQAGFPHHSVSLTGGEPLLHVEFLSALLPALDARGLPGYLETNGLLVEAFEALPCAPRFVAMDVKLPGTAGCAPAWEAHAAFLSAALARGAQVQVKLIFAEESLPEIPVAAAMLAAVERCVPCVLQPVTARPGGPPTPAPAAVLEAQRLAAMHLGDVRVIPQVHRLMDQW
jgi:7-carboxy-7-deazaguanine synthase